MLTELRVIWLKFWTKSEAVPIHAMGAWTERGGIAPQILNLGTRWSWTVKFTYQPLYTRKNPPYSWKKRRGESQARSERLSATWVRTPERPHHILVTIRATLPRLLKKFITLNALLGCMLHSQIISSSLAWSLREYSVKYKLCNEWIFGPKRDKLTGHWRKMFNRGFVTCTPHEIRENEIGGACSMHSGE